MAPSWRSGTFSKRAISAADTCPVAALTSVSCVPPSSVNVTCTLTVLPSSAAVSVQVAPVAPAISASALPSLAIHCQAYVAPLRPSASAIPISDAVSVSPTRAVPETAGSPVGGVFTESEVLFVTRRSDTATRTPSDAPSS